MNARQQLAEELGRRIPGCAVGTRFGHGSLHVGDKIFAFARTDESAAVKLPETRIAELLASGGEMRLLQMGQRTMREWLVVPNAAAPANLKLLREAMAYVSSLPPEKKRAKKKSAKSTPGKSAAKKAAKKSAPKRAAAKKAAKAVSRSAKK
ncbi:MAG TPA: hypothetical protein VN612_03225 [Acidobacteriaceae bacterium]|nr:hypothetical protein [Acidobacteriaceae bacterium]